MTAMRMLTAAMLATLPACTTAMVDEPRAASGPERRTLLAGCRQGSCSWLRLNGLESVRSGAEGELRRIVARRGRSLHRDGALPRRPANARIAWEDGDRSEYAFCSVRRPAYAFPSGDGELIVHFLDLFDLAGYQIASATLYMAICHGRDALPDEAERRALGYRPGTRSEQIEAATVETMTRF